MKFIHKFMIVSIILSIFTCIPLYSAMVRDIPMTLTQPNGESLACFASGDEFHNWLHDAKGFTIIKSPETGYYVYAEKQGDGIVAGTLIAGVNSPQEKNLEPNINISASKYKALRESKFYMPETRDAPTTGNINNIVIFIRFSDDSEFDVPIATYEGWFNSDANSQKNYFLEASYNQLTVNTTFYPSAVNGYIVSWQDTNPRSYYQPYNAATNPNGYSDDTESKNREFTLLANAVAGTQSSIPQDLATDMDNDGRVDNVVFTVKGSSDDWSDLLWPHRWSLYDRYVYLHGKRVYDFNFQLEAFLEYSSVGVICHEFYHTLGAPDLYHYTENGISPAGNWDVMEGTSNPPQHMGAYMKYKYGGWISSIPTITADAEYTLNPLTSSTGNCFRINSPNSASEYFVVEYRKQMGTFEASLPGSGLLVYRINPAYDGNADGPPDEVYIYRPNGTTSVNGTINSAYFSSDVGRTAINSTTNPTPFLTNGSAGGLVISNIGSAGATISFVKGEGAATITWTPDEIEKTVNINSSISQNITIGNTGNVSLNYTVSKPTNSTNVLDQGFESGQMPSGWSEQTDLGANVAWQFTSGGHNSNPNDSFEGLYNALFYHGSYTASVSKLISPELNLSGTESASLSFYHTQYEWAGDQDELRIYYRINPSASWNLLESYTESVTSWTQRTIELPNLSAVYQIAFEATGQYGYGVCLDAIEITKELVDGYSWLTIDGGNSYSGIVNPWSSSQAVSVALSSVGLNPGNYNAEITITSNSNSNSVVTIPVSMTVTDPSVPIPVTLDFEGSTEVPAEITLNNMAVANSHGNSSNVLFNNLSSSSTNAYAQFQSMNSITSNSVISFDYRIVSYDSPWAATDLINDHDYFLTLVSTDNGATFTAIDQINSLNHTSSQEMTNYLIDVGAYAGQTAIFRFEMDWAGVGDYYFDLDNIFFGNALEVTIPEGDGSPIAPIVLEEENVELEFTTPNPDGFSLQIYMIPALPTNNNGIPATMESFLPRTWRVISSVGNPGTYNITFDLTGLGISNYGLVRFFKRANSSAEWVDVINLGATLSWNENKVTISGLDTFSEFAPGIDETLPVTLASFNAVSTSNNFAQINWVTASETEVMGYNLFRAESDNQEEALKINLTMIEAINSALGGSYSYVDAEIETNQTYYYWLQTNSFSGSSEMFGPVTVKILEQVDHEIEEILLGTQLLGNYPNPFNPATTISFSVAESQIVTIDIYNIKGQLVQRVFNGKVDTPNVKHNVVWNGKDSDGRVVASGIYLTIMKAGNKRFSNKSILMK